MTPIRFFALWLLSLSVACTMILSGCIADSAFKVRGKLVLRSGKPPSDCALRLYLHSNQRFLDDQKIDADLLASFVIAPWERDYYMEVQCANTEAHRTQKYKLGNVKWLRNPLDLGTIVLNDGRTDVAPTETELAAQAKLCGLPPGLGEEISKKNARALVVSMVDLKEYHKELFQKEHGARCPGIVEVDFYGDGKPTWAVVLIEGENPKRRAELLVARQVSGAWETRSLEQTDGTPVVWREPPGNHEGHEGKVLRAANPVIVFCGYESWAIAYAWNGKAVEKVWLSD